MIFLDCEDRPSLHWRDPVNGANCCLQFGHVAGEPVAVLTVGDHLTAHLPREALLVAAHQGWATACPHCQTDGTG